MILEMLSLPQMQIKHLYISPGHNFFGRHGQPPGDHAIQEVSQIECVAGRGILGDRFLDFKTDYRGQITLFAFETFERLSKELGIVGKTPAVFRRNVITAGVDMNTLIGKAFAIQGVHFQGVEECRPCDWMNMAFGPGAESSLRGYGGLRARILSDGILRADKS